jgi:hypothetical protein
MNRQMIPAVLFLSLCPLVVAQQSKPAVSLAVSSQPAPAEQQTADLPQSSAVAERIQALRMPGRFA